MSETVKISLPVAGIDNVSNETKLPDGAIRSGVNIDLDRNGIPSRRKGSEKLYSGTNIHSLHERHFVEEGSLKYLNNDNTASTLRSGVSSNPMCYITLNDEIFYSNGVITGKIVNGISLPWGIKEPNGLPNISVTTGLLKAGLYMVSLCHVDQSTLEQSGATNSIVVDIKDNEGIFLENIPQSPDGYSTIIFISNASGDGTLYYHSEIPLGQTSAIISSIGSIKKKCETLFMQKFPPGDMIIHYRGRIYSAKGKILWYSQEQNFGLYKPSENFFQFSEDITVVLPVHDGIYVVSDKTYFLSGSSPKEMQLVVSSPDSGKARSGLKVDSKHFNLDAPGDVAFWYSNKGAVVGMNGGQIKSLTEDKYSMPELGSGMSAYHESDGIRRIISTFFDVANPSNTFGATDRATAEVIRNGVTIN